MSGFASPFNVEYQYLKEGKYEIYKITWTFPKFKQLLNATQVKEFCTPVVEDQLASKFQLKMSFELEAYNDRIDIYYLSPTPVDLRAEVLLSVNGSTQSDPNGLIKYNVKGTEADYLTVQKYDLLRLINFSKSNIKCLLANLICQFKLVVFPGDAVEELQSLSETKHFEDFAKLLADETYFDVTLKSVDGKERRAHKAVLATRSHVLKAHFEHNTTEAVTNVIETPFEYDVLQDVLAYIYACKATRIDDIPEKLFVAADYYQLSALKSLCEEAMQQRLTVENAIETLQLAELHLANSLKQSTLKFIKLQFHLIMKTEAWAKLQSAQLIKKILEYIHGSS